MFTTRDGERLYLSNWQYNATLILAELRKIIANNGGNVKPVHTAIITNRTLEEAKKEAQERYNHLVEIEKQFPNGNDKRKEAIKEYKDRYERYSSVKNDPIEIACASWATFTLDNNYYSLSLDDNPFFPFHLIKTRIKEGKYSQDASAEEFSKNWLYDCFFRCDASEADRKEAANLIFNELIKAKCSPIIRSKKRIRVPNTYDTGYHYEIIYEKERIAAITF